MKVQKLVEIGVSLINLVVAYIAKGEVTMLVELIFFDDRGLVKNNETRNLFR